MSAFINFSDSLLFDKTGFSVEARGRQGEVDKVMWRYRLIPVRYGNDQLQCRGDQGAICVDPQSMFEQVFHESC